MLFVLSGPWGVGKSETIEYLVKNFDFETIIPWSTKVNNEQRGIKYNQLMLKADPDKGIPLNELVAEAGFWCQPFNLSGDNRILGYRLNEIATVTNRNAAIIEADTDVAAQLKQAAEKGIIGRVVTIFLNYKSDSVFKHRLNKESQYSDKERAHKKKHKEKEVSFYDANGDMFDEIVSEDNRDQIPLKIAKIAFDTYKIDETPSMLHKKPGLLGQMDIRLAMSVMRPSSAKIKITIPKEYEEQINGYLNPNKPSYINSTLTSESIHYPAVDLFLSPDCYVINKGFQNQKIDLILGEASKLCEIFDASGLSTPDEVRRVVSTKDLKNVRKLVKDSRDKIPETLFEQKKISVQEPLILGPQETAMCSSLESIQTGNDIFVLITAKHNYLWKGLSVSLSPNVLQPGHKGKVMLQLKNNLHVPISLPPFIQIAQCIFFRTISNSEIKHEQMSFGPQQDETEVFMRVADDVISNKNWHEALAKSAIASSSEEARKKQHGTISWIALVISVLTFITAVLAIVIPIITS